MWVELAIFVLVLAGIAADQTPSPAAPILLTNAEVTVRSARIPELHNGHP